MPLTLDEIKKKVGYFAAELVEPKTIIGLGTGSTAKWFIEALSKRCAQGLKIKAVATSHASEHLAKLGNIPLLDINEIEHIDQTFDGADEVDTKKQLIKGAGGALVREKIIASMSKQLIILVDESKLSKVLGKKPLPLEIIPFGIKAIEKQLNRLGLEGKWRTDIDGSFFTTDNGNYLYDISFKKPPSDPEALDKQLHRIPGIVDTGYFFHLAGRILVGFKDGQILTQ